LPFLQFNKMLQSFDTRNPAFSTSRTTIWYRILLLACLGSTVSGFAPPHASTTRAFRMTVTRSSVLPTSAGTLDPAEVGDLLSNEFVDSLKELNRANQDAKHLVLEPLVKQEEERAVILQETKLKEEESRVPSLRYLGSFFATTTLIWLSEPLLSLVDTTVVGLTQTGARGVMQLAAMSPSTTLMDTLLWSTYFLALATTNQLAEQQARGEYRNLQITTSRLLSLALISGGIVTALTAFAGPTMLGFLSGRSASTELITLASGYSWIRGSVAPLAVMGMVAQSACLVTGNTGTVAKAVLLASVSNILGDLLLTPKFGIYGAAAATAVASASSAFLLIRKVHSQMRIWRKKEEEQEAEQERVGLAHMNPTDTYIASPFQTAKNKPVPFLSLPDMASFSKLVKLTLPLAFRMWATMFSYASLAVRATDFGVRSLAAHNILLRVFWFLTCFSDSVGTTTQSFAPVTLYPKFLKKDFRDLSRKLAVMAAIGTGIGTLAARTLLMGNAAGVLARDAGIVMQIQSAAPYVVTLLAMHPWICIMEGVVISKRNFPKLVRTYVAAVAALGISLSFSCTSMAHVWRAMVVWQVTRLVGYLIGGGKKKPTLAVE
jgi:Na+-driven multidrug efflux pump